MQKENSQALKTILTIVIGLLVISFSKRAHNIIYVALVIGIAGVVSPYLAVRIEIAWMKLAKVFSFIGPTILLTVIFYLFLFPLALLSRLFKKKDPLMLSDIEKSTFVTMNKKFTSQSFERPW